MTAGWHCLWLATPAIWVAALSAVGLLGVGPGWVLVVTVSWLVSYAWVLEGWPQTGYWTLLTTSCHAEVLPPCPLLCRASRWREATRHRQAASAAAPLVAWLLLQHVVRRFPETAEEVVVCGQPRVPAELGVDARL